MTKEENFYRGFSWLFILTLSVHLNYISAQSKNQNEFHENGSEILAEAFAFKADSLGKGRLDIYVQIPYPNINFVKQGDFYTGRVELSATVLTQEKQELWHKNQTVELQLKDFSQTVSNRLSCLKQFSIDMLPGNYSYILEVTDYESKKTFSLQKSVVVKDFNADSLAISDVMLVHKISVDGPRRNIVPNLSGTLLQGLDDFYLFFEIYNRVRLDSSQLTCKWINPKQQIIDERAKNETFKGNRTQVIWRIDTPALAADRYILSIEVAGYDKAHQVRQLRASNSRSCLVRMKDVPLSITNIDLATDQLIYIAKGSEMDYIREATTSEEKQKRFLAFWAKRDPDPQTPGNELMEEYYARVSYANKNFSHHSEGWRTDRGMVLIQFGPPQNVDRHPFDSDSKPYEIWYYYDLNREFIFVDETGFGDYRLRYPGTDLWGRIR